MPGGDPGNDWRQLVSLTEGVLDTGHDCLLREAATYFISTIRRTARKSFARSS